MIAQVHGIPLVYDDVGAGPPLVLLHGFPQNRHLWEAQRTALSARYRVITPDLGGFGESGVAEPYSMDQYADDVAALLAHLGVTSTILGGLSLGGYIAFAFWRRHRALVRGLILCDTKAAADTEETRTKRRGLIETARTQGMAAVADAQITGMIGATTRTTRPQLVASLWKMLAAAPVEGVVGALQAMMARPDSTPTLATIDVPTLCIVGDEDVLTPVRELRAIHKQIANSTLQIIPQAGHVSNIEQPDVFNAALLRHMA